MIFGLYDVGPFLEQHKEFGHDYGIGYYKWVINTLLIWLLLLLTYYTYGGLLMALSNLYLKFDKQVKNISAHPGPTYDILKFKICNAFRKGLVPE